MEKVRVNRTELLTQLRGNRADHQDEWIEAFAGWKVKVRDAFHEASRQIENDDYSNLNPASSLPKPVNHLKDYDLAIKMLEMSVDDNVEIEQYDFNRYVMDEWEWKAGFALTNSSYLG